MGHMHTEGPSGSAIISNSWTGVLTVKLSLFEGQGYSHQNYLETSLMLQCNKHCSLDVQCMLLFCSPHVCVLHW